MREKLFIWIPKWSDLNKIGRSPLASATILIPLIGYFILFNEFVVEMFNYIDEAIWNTPDSGVSPNENISIGKIKLLYIGLWLFGLSSVIFNLLCPRIVKLNESQSEYVNSYIPSLNSRSIEGALSYIKSSNLWYRNIVFRESDFGSIKIQNIQTRAGVDSAYGEERSLLRKDWIEKNYDNIAHILDAEFQLKDNSYVFLRGGILLLYASGIFCVSLPSLSVLWAVLRSF